jgi:hypothetical protein
MAMKTRRITVKMIGPGTLEARGEHKSWRFENISITVELSRDWIEVKKIFLIYYVAKKFSVSVVAVFWSYG